MGYWSLISGALLSGRYQRVNHMFSQDTKHRNLLIIILITVISLIAFIIGRHLSDGYHGNVISVVGKPVETLLSGAGEGIRSFWENLSSFTTTSRENQSLMEKNARLSAELEQVKILREENVTLRQLLDLKIEMKGEGVSAEIIARDPTNWFERFTLNQGKAKGISKNMIVEGPEGLVGQITILDDRSATVRTILNPRSAIPVYVVESGTYGILYGDGSQLCTIKFIRNISFLQEGHLVVTSGLGDIFPAGILVGKITNVQGSVDSLSTQAKVKPFIDLEKLKFVLITRGKN